MKTALITGGAQRIGAQICQTLHANGFNIIIHYRHSKKQASTLAQKLNNIRPNSAQILLGELNDLTKIKTMCASINTLDALINNASGFYPTPIDALKVEDYHNLMNTNIMAPLFLSSILAPKLQKNQGCIVNIVDIHAERPLKNYPIYSISKAGTKMLTKTLAKELAPKIRVCGVSPGSILWPENAAELSKEDKQKMLEKIALKKQGSASDIAESVLFLLLSDYITGQIINVDGGRTLNQ
jgi:pteridine reductase